MNPIIDCQFNIDLNKIEALISSLNGRELLSSVSIIPKNTTFQT